MLSKDQERLYVFACNGVWVVECRVGVARVGRVMTFYKRDR